MNVLDWMGLDLRNYYCKFFAHFMIPFFILCHRLKIYNNLQFNSGLRLSNCEHDENEKWLRNEYQFKEVHDRHYFF